MSNFLKPGKREKKTPELPFFYLGAVSLWMIYLTQSQPAWIFLEEGKTRAVEYGYCDRVNFVRGGQWGHPRCHFALQGFSNRLDCWVIQSKG